MPAWILEGLEKAEAEKRKKFERDLKEQNLKEAREAKVAKRAEAGLGKFVSIPSKSKVKIIFRIHRRIVMMM